MPNPDDFGPMSPEDWSDLQDCADRFEKAWKENPDAVKIDEYLPAFNSSFRRSVLYELVKLDLEFRWDSDKAFPLDWYLEHYPELGTRETVSAQLIFEELRNKHKHGVPVKLDSYQKNYPLQFPKLKQLIDSGLGTLGGSSATPGRTSGGRSGNAVIPETGVLAREYELIKKIGEGSFAEVWMARHTDSGKEVAVKYLHRPMSADESQRELESLELMKRLEHPHLLEFHSYWIEHNRLWVVMGLATHGTIKTRLRECKRQGLTAIPVDELTGYMAQIADAIDYLHDEGIQHRDIKPENVLLFGRRYAKLADFGLAKQMAPEKDRTRTIGGTPLYQAPEMFDGDVVNRMSDQYCFAFTYSELRLGESPFHGRPLHKLPIAHKTETPDLHALPPLEQAVLLRALAKDPAARYPSCKDFVSELIAAIAESRRLGLIPAMVKTPSGLESRPALGKKTGPTPVGQQSADAKTPPSTHDGIQEQRGKRSTLDAPPPSPLQTPTSSPVMPAYQTPSSPVAQTPSSTPVEPRTDPAAGTIRFGKPGSRRPPTQEFQLPRSTDSPETPPAPVKPVPPVKPVAPAAKTFEVEDYLVSEVLGKGEFGEVRKARHKVTGREVALKRLYRSVDDDVTRREIEHLRSFKDLKHESLVQFLDCIVDKTDQAWIVMELADGGSLKDRLHACRRGIPLAELLPYIKQIASALDYLNGRDIVHRDVKPANILLAGGVAKLTDFGLARLSVNDVTKTLGGTPLYQSPEMFEGKVVKGASDQYCLAMTYAELRRGEHPFADYLEGAGKKRGVQHAHRFEAPNLRGLSEGEQKVLKTALAKQYQDRFVTCTEFVEALQEAVAEEATAAVVSKKSDEFEAEPDFKYEDEPASGGFGWLTAAVLLLAVIGGGIGFYFWNRPKPDAIAGEIKNNIDQFVRADPPDVDKAWIEVEKGDKLGSPWKEDVREHFTDFTHNRIADLENAGAMKTATATAKLVRNHMPEDTELDGTKRKWLQTIDGQIGRGAVAALSEIRDFGQILPDEKLPSPYHEVLNSAKAIEAVESGKGKADDAFASLQALPDQAARLRQPLYRRVADECLKKNQFRPVFDAVKVAKLWPDATQYRANAYDTLLLQLKTATVAYNDLVDWELSKIYNAHLTESEKPKILEQVQSKYTRRMETWLNELPKKFPTDQGWRALLRKVEGLPKEYEESYEAKLKGGPDELLEFWKRVDALVSYLEEKNPQPKEVFQRYVAVMDAKDVLDAKYMPDSKDKPAPLDLDKQTRRVLVLAKENGGAFDEASLKKIAVKRNEFKLRDETVAMAVGVAQMAPVGQIANLLAKAATLYGKGDFAECKKQLAAVDKNAKDFKENRAKFDALDALVHAQLVDTDVPRLVGAWKTLPAGDKTELGKHFAAVADKYLKDHWREAPAGDQKNGWRLRLDLCEASPPESSAVVAASALECRIELKEAKDLPAEWQSLSALLQKSRWPGEPQVGRAYSGYLKALAHAADKQKAAEALVEIKEALPQLPSDYRKQKAITMLADASPVAKRQGPLKKQFENNDALSAFTWLSVAEELANESKLRVDKERLIDLVLAAGNQEKLDSSSSKKFGTLAASLIADKDLFNVGALSKALYPLTMAYARLSGQPVTVVRAYAELLDRLKAADRREIGDLEFSRDFLRKGIDQGRTNLKQLQDPEDTAKLARLVGEQADMILVDKEDAEKLALWNKEFNGDALVKAQALFAEASKLDSKNATYLAGSEWLTGFSKLKSARAEQGELAKLSAYGTSITALELALESAKGLQGRKLLFLARLYLDLHQAELEFGNFYSDLNYGLPQGYGKNFDAAENTKVRLSKALACAQDALAKLELAKKALNGAGDETRDLEIRVREALGNAYEDLAYLAALDQQKNYANAEGEFNIAIDALKSERPATRTGRGRVRYNWALSQEDAAKSKDLLQNAEADLGQAIQLAGNGWEAIEPTYFLAKVYESLDEDKLGRPEYYGKVRSLYAKLASKPSESNSAQSTAREYAKRAILELARRQPGDLVPYSQLMQGVDPSSAAELFLRQAVRQVALKQGNDQRLALLRKIAGANAGELESAVVVLRSKFEIAKYRDPQTDSIDIPANERAPLLTQLRKNCDIAPDNYLKLWSRFALASILFSKDPNDRKEAKVHYQEGKKLADQLLKKHGGKIQYLKDYRNPDKVTQWKAVDEWEKLFVFYEDGAKLLRAMADLKEAAKFVSVAAELAPPDLKERVETLKRNIEDELRMK